MYSAPVTGTLSRGIVHWQSLWLAGTARGCRWHGPAGYRPLRLATQNGVNV